MPSPLSGDFEAVLQVSGRVINRLLASLHQNAFELPHLPSFPHSIGMRIGDGRAIDRVRGRVDAQVSVPRVALIHGATDRFLLEVGIRAWYRADPGSEPLPAFIHGTVRAEYRFEAIDPQCVGWRHLAGDYLWVRVVKDSVRFEGTAEKDWAAEDDSFTARRAADAESDATTQARITRQIAGLLATRFEAAPQPVSDRFKRGTMRSLNTAIGGAAVVLPLGLSVDQPVGDIASVDRVLLEGADFAVGVDVNYVMTQVRAVLGPANVNALSQTIPVGTFTVYRVRVDPPVVSWEPRGTHAVIRVKVNGTAKTNSWLADAAFLVDQEVHFTLDAGRLVLRPGPRVVAITASGLFSGTVSQFVRAALDAAVGPIIADACAKAQPTLDTMTSRMQPLLDQLRKLDEQANVAIDRAAFSADGVVLRGTIALAPRKAPALTFARTAQNDGHSALQSWIPGGRIDQLEWSWRWFGAGAPAPRTVVHGDRFLLRRPGRLAGRWGTQLGLTDPLPGVDGWGSVCLRLRGVQVDAVSGELVPVETAQRCIRFGVNIAVRIADAPRLFLRDVPERSRNASLPELALFRADTGHAAADGANTLLLHADGGWDQETASALREGLNRCRRFDAGLSLLVLFREGSLDDADPSALAEIAQVAQEAGIAVLANEDVRGAWSSALGLHAGTGDPGWGLIGPSGVVAWAHQGRISGEALGAALDTHLEPSRSATPMPIAGEVEIGSRISATALHPGVGPKWSEIPEFEDPCPPIPLGRLGAGGAIVAFVQKGSSSSAARLRELSAQFGKRAANDPLVVAVVDGADAEGAEALRNELGLDFAVLPDPAGAVTDRFGVAVWPSTMTLDRAGVVSEIRTGFVGRSDSAPNEPPDPDDPRPAGPLTVS